MTRAGARVTSVLVAAGLLAGAGYMALETARLLLNGPAPSTASLAAPLASAGAAPVPTQAVAQVAAPAVTREQVQAWRLFGVYQGGKVAPAGRTAPESALDMTLLGVFRGGSDTQGWAIIQAGGKHAGLYRPGDALAGGITLHALHADYVLLERGGGLERLSLLAWDAIRGIALATAPAATADNNAKPPPLNDREKAMKRFGVQPVVPGTAAGYRIVDEKGELVKNMGFRVGDVFVSVNGYPLGTREADLLARQSVADAGTGNIIVQRGGKPYLIEYRADGGVVRGLAALVARNGKGDRRTGP